ncbi:MAG: ATP-binding cassette domain-containing protein [Phycisphaeraceae bacterium]|nr:ATP-binding cassette domain-containing protein [Phycisphaeraceae bacterium]
MITITDVSKSFDRGRTHALRSVSIHAHAGEVLVLLGSSGCGKTTLLRMINRLDSPDSGEVRLRDRDVCGMDPVALRRSIGYVIQEGGLFPHMTVERNVEIVPRLLGWNRDTRRARTHEILSLVGLSPDEFLPRRPAELSGGQRQRVGIARALAANPMTLLMDEPFGALDAITRDRLQDEILSIQRSEPRTIVFVTHDLFEAVRLADRIVVLHAGSVEQVGTAEQLLNHPATPYVSSLFERATQQATGLLEHAP